MHRLGAFVIFDGLLDRFRSAGDFPRGGAASSISALVAGFGLRGGRSRLAGKEIPYCRRIRRRSARTGAARLAPRPKPRPSTSRMHGWQIRCQAPTTPPLRRAGAIIRLTALLISAGIMADRSSFIFSNFFTSGISSSGMENIDIGLSPRRFFPSSPPCAVSLNRTFRPALSCVRSIPPPPAPARRDARCARTRRCAAPPRRGNAASGPGSAMPPHRPARRSCGPPPAW